MSVLEAIGRVVVTLLLAGGIGLIVRTLVSKVVRVDEGQPNRIADGIGGVAALAGFIWLFGDTTESFLNSPEAAKLASTIWGVLLAVTASAALFVGANVLFDQASKNYTLFKTAIGAFIGFVTFGLLDGNRLIQWINGRETVANALHDIVNANSFTLFIFSILIGAVITAPYGWAYGTPRDEPQRFAAISAGVGASAGALWGLFFAERIPVDTAVTVLWTPLLGAILVGALGFVLSKTEQPVRLAVGTAGGLGIGLLVGGLLYRAVTPRLEVVPFLAWTIGLAAVGAGIAHLRGKRLLDGALTGAILGWIIGAFVVTGVGGPRSEALAACGVLGALAGARFGSPPLPDSVKRTEIENESRSPIFLAPAAFFISVGLVIPLIRTMYLSLTESVRNTDSRGRSNQFAGIKNYETIFGSDSNWDLSQWTDMFTRAPFELGLLLALIGFTVALLIGRRSGHSYGGSGILTPLFGVIAIAAAFFQLRLIGDDGSESAQGDLVEAASTPLWRYAYVLIFLLGGIGLLYAAINNVGFGGSSSSSGSSKIHKFPIDFSGGHGGMLAFGLFLIVTGVFATLRGTVLNSIWWVFAVTVLSTVFGLGIAALADRAKLENVAKSIIFMPLAISFVGAGIIWRFMYIARPQGQPQTGILNYLWLKLGDLSGSSARWIGVLILLAIVLGAFAVAYTGYLKKARGLIGVGIAMSLPFLWLAWRLAQGRLGGTGEVTLDRTIFFLSQDLPYNNLWLMVVLIWIQTGFAMVIFSAAIKAVPSEFIEAARVDGATESSIFWRIIVPQIVPTIGVVVTTLIVTVLKVFDIVKVMTNGNFGTQIVANEMFFQAFTVGDQGVGSALAVILFVAVLPIVVINIRRLQAEEA